MVESREKFFTHCLESEDTVECFCENNPKYYACLELKKIEYCLRMKKQDFPCSEIYLRFDDKKQPGSRLLKHNINIIVGKMERATGISSIETRYEEFEKLYDKYQPTKPSLQSYFFDH